MKLVCRLLLGLSAVLAGACARGESPAGDGTRDGSVPGATALAAPEVVCPQGTERDTRTSAEGIETYCFRVEPANPNVDIGPGRTQTGPSVTRAPDGKVLASGEFAHGVKTGPWRYFYRTGAPFADGAYDDKGRRTGVWTELRSNGKLRTEVTFVDGSLDGPWRHVWGGVVVGEGAFRRDERAGAWTSRYCAGGAVHETLTFGRGKLEGPCARFEADGRKTLDGEYRAGKKSGTWRETASNGTRFESTWADDARDGPFRWVVADGTVVMEGALRAGRLEGRWVVRDASGTVAKEGVYEHDRLVSGTEVTTVPRLNGYETNAYCTDNFQGLNPTPTPGGPFAGADQDLTSLVCRRE
jgi:antitoxin component YwqK of YwqJK toxin-antitoxin module